MGKTYFDMGANRRQEPDLDLRLIACDGAGFRAYEEALETLRAMTPAPWDAMLQPIDYGRGGSRNIYSP